MSRTAAATQSFSSTVTRPLRTFGATSCLTAKECEHAQDQAKGVYSLTRRCRVGERLSVPAPSECLHSGLPCCLISVRRRSVLVIPISQRPHPGCPRRRFCYLKNAPDDESASIDDVIIIITLSVGATRLSSSE